MKNQLVIIGIVVILVSVGLSGCEEEKSKFVGTWAIDIEARGFRLFSNGTFDGGDITGTWDVKNGKLTITLPNLQNQSVTRMTFYNYSFSNNDKILILNAIGEGLLTGIWTKH